MATAATATRPLPELLTGWREEHRLGIAQAARRAGVQPRTWLSWESGTVPQLSVLPGLAAALGLQCADLLEMLPTVLDPGVDERGEVAAAIRAWRRREAISLCRAARRIGVAPSTVLDWEAGRRPRRSQLGKLVAAGVVTTP